MFVYNTRVRRILPYYYGHLMLCDKIGIALNY